VRRLDFDRDLPPVVTWGEVAVFVGAMALCCFVAYEAAVAVTCLIRGAW
jgi:hypothetical protein